MEGKKFEDTDMTDKPPEQKDNSPFELLKHLLPPAIGFLSAAILIYNFYQLWLGNQAPITYFGIGGGLLILMIALAWVGFKVNNSTPNVLLPDDATATKKMPIYQFIARVSLVIVFVGALISVGVLFQHRHTLKENQFTRNQGDNPPNVGQITNPAYKSPPDIMSITANPQEPEKLMFVIATFEGPEEVGRLRNEIIEKLDLDFLNNQRVEIVKIDDIITADQGSADARKLGKHSTADIVIWGWYRPSQNPNITIHIENLNPDKIIPPRTRATVLRAVTLTELESFSFQQESGQETSAVVSFLAGYTQYTSGNYAAALLHFDDALNKTLDKAKLLINNRAEIYSTRGATYIHLKQYDQAISDFSKVIEINPQLVEAYNNRGFAYYALQQYDKAIADYAKIIQINPQDAEAYTNRGITYTDLQQYDQAMADFAKAIQIDPEYADTYYHRGLAYQKLNEIMPAKADFAKAIEVNPQYAEAYNSRGIAYYYLQQYEQALADFSKAIEIYPEYAEAYYDRGLVYCCILKQYEQAIADDSKAIQLGIQKAGLYNSRGVAYYNLKQYEQAIADYSKAIEINPQFAEVYTNRGLVYAHMEQYEQAIADHSKAIEINPQLAGPYNNRGIAYYNLKKCEEAIADDSKAIQLNPQYAEAYYNRALSYQELGKIAEAEADFAKYKKLTGKENP
jgi:tetratricopeptide (TPR) repeat protein